MKTVWAIAGLLLLALGVIWIVYVTGAVFSHTEGFTKLGELWPAIGFHTLSTGLGMFCLGRTGIGLRPGEAPAKAQKEDKPAPVLRG